MKSVTNLPSSWIPPKKCRGCDFHDGLGLAGRPTIGTITRAAACSWGVHGLARHQKFKRKLSFFLSDINMVANSNFASWYSVRNLRTPELNCHSLRSFSRIWPQDPAVFPVDTFNFSLNMFLKSFLCDWYIFLADLAILQTFAHCTLDILYRKRTINMSLKSEGHGVMSPLISAQGWEHWQ